MSLQIKLKQHLVMKPGAKEATELVLSPFVNKGLTVRGVPKGNLMPPLSFDNDDDYEGLLLALLPHLEDKSYLCWIDGQDNFEVVLGYVHKGEIIHAWDDNLIQPYLDKLESLTKEDAPLVLAKGCDREDVLTVLAKDLLEG
jgi:hypothetical protein